MLVKFLFKALLNFNLNLGRKLVNEKLYRPLIVFELLLNKIDYNQIK